MDPHNKLKRCSVFSAFIHFCKVHECLTLYLSPINTCYTLNLNISQLIHLCKVQKCSISPKVIKCCILNVSHPSEPTNSRCLQEHQLPRVIPNLSDGAVQRMLAFVNVQQQHDLCLIYTSLYICIYILFNIYHHYTSLYIIIHQCQIIS